ncbi:DUF413 domain-containing protein [Ferrimonas sp. SCSIO 43195]|uniref:DUF413 domain-containing protein n=1 Tax=Ferrimonas sp. SCSIO 43195 TaxID=2822844 RepID=UPI00207623C0|nr:DUF413 domain-containing protein [Ferrimonas sp. SCSIO 43195]USD37985.1 DUF413 domain-containing protein [Ferrimonas sp. SCSIO 43195]
MNQIEGFQAAGRFFDDKHFPRGFARSGHFTLNEAALLEHYGQRLRALAEGTQTPASAQEQQFVAVAKGERPADNKLEQAWTKYIAKSQRRKLFTMSSKAPVAGEEEDESVSAEDDDLIELD